jgi:hypothetical protein
LALPESNAIVEHDTPQPFFLVKTIRNQYFRRQQEVFFCYEVSVEREST